jgi:excisionase family DNA binding protein
MSQYLVDVAVVAERLGVSVSYVRARVFHREIPFYKIGGAVRFDPGEVEAWLSEQKVDSGGVAR